MPPIDFIGKTEQEQLRKRADYYLDIQKGYDEGRINGSESMALLNLVTSIGEYVVYLRREELKKNGN